MAVSAEGTRDDIVDSDDYYTSPVVVAAVEPVLIVVLPVVERVFGAQ